MSEMDSMKQILDLIAFKVDKKSEDYMYYRKEIMDYFYKGLQKLFKTMEKNHLIEICECKANLRQGFKKCPKCSGAGFKNKESK